MSSLKSWLGLNQLTTAVRKRLARFAVHKSLGKFLKYKVALEQIHTTDFDTFTLVGLELDPDYLSTLLADVGLKVVYGFVGEVEGFIPFKNLLEEGCSVSVHNIDLVLAPKDNENVRRGRHMEAAELVQTLEESINTFERELAEEFDHAAVEEGVAGPLPRQYSEDMSDEAEREEGLDSLTYLVKSIMSRMTGSVTNLRIYFTADEDGAANSASSGADAGTTRALLLHFESLRLKDTTADTAAPTRDNDHARMDVAVSPETHKEVVIGRFALRFVEAPGGRISEEFLESNAALGKLILHSCSRESVAQTDNIALLIRSQPEPDQCKMEVRGVLQDVRAVLDPSILSHITRITVAFSEASTSSSSPSSSSSSSSLRAASKPGTASSTSTSSSTSPESSTDGTTTTATAAAAESTSRQKAIQCQVRVRQLLVTTSYAPDVDTLHSEPTGILAATEGELVARAEDLQRYRSVVPPECLLTWLRHTTIDVSIGDPTRTDTRYAVKDAAVLEFSPNHAGNNACTVLSFPAVDLDTLLFNGDGDGDSDDCHDHGGDGESGNGGGGAGSGGNTTAAAGREAATSRRQSTADRIAASLFVQQEPAIDVVMTTGANYLAQHGTTDSASDDPSQRTAKQRGSRTKHPKPPPPPPAAAAAAATSTAEDGGAGGRGGEPTTHSEGRMYAPAMGRDATVKADDSVIHVTLGRAVCNLDLTLLDRLHFVLDSLSHSDRNRGAQRSTRRAAPASDTRTSSPASENADGSASNSNGGGSCFVVSAPDLRFLCRPSVPTMVSPHVLASTFGPPMVPAYRTDAFAATFRAATLTLRASTGVSMLEALAMSRGDCARAAAATAAAPGPSARPYPQRLLQAWAQHVLPALRLDVAFDTAVLSLAEGFSGRTADVPLIVLDKRVQRPSSPQPFPKGAGDVDNGGDAGREGAAQPGTGDTPQSQQSRTDPAADSGKANFPKCHMTVLVKSEAPAPDVATSHTSPSPSQTPQQQPKSRTLGLAAEEVLEFVSPLTAVLQKSANREVTHPQPPQRMRDFVASAWCHAEYTVGLDVGHVQADLPKQDLDAFYQLLMDFVEWSPWKPETSSSTSGGCGGGDANATTAHAGNANHNKPRTDGLQSSAQQTPSVGSTQQEHPPRSVRWAEGQPQTFRYDAPADTATTVTTATSATTVTTTTTTYADEDEDDNAASRGQQRRARSAGNNKGRAGASAAAATGDAEGRTARALQHLACVTLRARSGHVRMLEPSTQAQSLAVGLAARPTAFELAFGAAQLVVAQGVYGTNNRDIVFSCMQPQLHQYDFSPAQRLCHLQPSPHLSQLGQLLEEVESAAVRTSAGLGSDGSGSDPLHSSTHTTSATNATGTAGVPELTFVVDMHKAAALTTTLCLQLSSSRLHYHPDPVGIWLTRVIGLLDFPDPPDWPKAAPGGGPSITKLAVSFFGVDVMYQPKHLASALVAEVAQLSVTSNMVSKTPFTIITFDVDDLSVRLVDDTARLARHARKGTNQGDWFACGWRQVIASAHTHVHLRLCDDASAPSLDVLITNREGVVSLCADSCLTLIDLVNYFLEDGDLQDTLVPLPEAAHAQHGGDARQPQQQHHHHHQRRRQQQQQEAQQPHLHLQGEGVHEAESSVFEDAVDTFQQHSEDDDDDDDAAVFFEAFNGGEDRTHDTTDGDGDAADDDDDDDFRTAVSYLPTTLRRVGSTGASGSERGGVAEEHHGRQRGEQGMQQASPQSSADGLPQHAAPSVTDHEHLQEESLEPQRARPEEQQQQQQPREEHPAMLARMIEDASFTGTDVDGGDSNEGVGEGGAHVDTAATHASSSPAHVDGSPHGSPTPRVKDMLAQPLVAGQHMTASYWDREADEAMQESVMAHSPRPAAVNREGRRRGRDDKRGGSSGGTMAPLTEDAPSLSSALHMGYFGDDSSQEHVQPAAFTKVATYVPPQAQQQQGDGSGAAVDHGSGGGVWASGGAAGGGWFEQSRQLTGQLSGWVWGQQGTATSSGRHRQDHGQGQQQQGSQLVQASQGRRAQAEEVEQQQQQRRRQEEEKEDREPVQEIGQEQEQEQEGGGLLSTSSEGNSAMTMSVYEDNVLTQSCMSQDMVEAELHMSLQEWDGDGDAADDDTDHSRRGRHGGADERSTPPLEVPQYMSEYVGADGVSEADLSQLLQSEMQTESPVSGTGQPHAEHWRQHGEGNDGSQSGSGGGAAPHVGRTMSDSLMQSEEIVIVENHFRPSANDDQDVHAYAFLPMPKQRIVLRRMEVSLRLHEGRDWAWHPDDGTSDETEADHAAPAANGIGARVRSVSGHGVQDGEGRLRTGSGASTRSRLSAASGASRASAGSGGGGGGGGSRASSAYLYEEENRLGPRRDDAFVEVRAGGLTLVQEQYRPGQPYASRLVLAVRQLDVLDRLPTSFVNRMVTDYSSRDLPRESNSNMLRVEMMKIRTPGLASVAEESDDSSVTAEMMMTVDVLPLRINIDQDTLNFLMGFLGYEPPAERIDENWELISMPTTPVPAGAGSTTATGMESSVETVRPPESPTAAASEAGGGSGGGSRAHVAHGSATASSHQRKSSVGALEDVLEEANRVSSARGGDGDVEASNDDADHDAAGTSSGGKRRRRGRGGGAEGEDEEDDDDEEDTLSSGSSGSGPGGACASGGTYFKLVQISPLILVVDYEPRRVNMSGLVGGDLRELAGILSLSNARLSLLPVAVRGVAGWDALLQELSAAWMQSLARAPQAWNLVLAGLPGGTSAQEVVRAGVGVLQEPVSQYPYVMRGVRDGVLEGMRTTAVESCNVATALVFALQTAVEVAHGMTGADDADVWNGPQFQRSKFAAQPSGFQDGLRKAYAAMTTAVTEAYSDVFVRPQDHARRRGTSAVVRAMGSVPGAGLRPLIGLCQAAALTIQGIRNGLSPERMEDLKNKYKTS